MKISINKEAMKDFVNGVCSLALVVTGFVLKEKLTKVATDLCNRSLSYGDAVDAVMNSGMWSADKKKALALVKKDQDCEYYKAVINAVNSNSWSQDKIDMIKILNQE